MNDKSIKNKYPAVSVIIPVYNAEDYLSECLDSVLRQTLQDFEIICIDDGSTDRSYEIICEYADNNSCIRMLQQKNKFAGAARNAGINNSRGKYLYFLDSDDFIAPDLLEKAVAKADAAKADIVAFNGFRYDSRTGTISNNTAWLMTNAIGDLEVFSKNDIPDDIFTFSNPAAWTKLYRRDFVNDNNLRFQEIPSANDLRFTKLAFAVAERIVTIDERLMYYRSGIGTNLQSIKNTIGYSFMSALEKLHRDLIERNIYDDVKSSFWAFYIDCLHYELLPSQFSGDKAQAYEAVFGNPLTKELFADEASLFKELTNQRSINRFNDIKKWKTAYSFNKNLSEGKHNVIRQECGEGITSPTISIIVFIDNDGQNLSKCLESIHNQSFKSREVVIVKTEQSGCSNYRDLFFKARGEYVLSVDCDTVLLPDALEKLHRHLKGEDIVLFNEDSTNDVWTVFEYLSDNNMGKDINNSCFCGIDLLDVMLGQKRNCTTLDTQLIRKQFIVSNASVLDSPKMFSNRLFFYKTLLLAQNVSICQEIIISEYSEGTKDTQNYKAVHDQFQCYQGLLSYYYDYYSRTDPNTVPRRKTMIKLTEKILSDTRSLYQTLSPTEKLFYLGYDGLEMQLFKSLVVDYSRIESEIKATKKKIDNKVAELNSIKHMLEKTQSRLDITKQKLDNNKKSTSYKIGRAITWAPRKVKKTIGQG